MTMGIGIWAMHYIGRQQATEAIDFGFSGSESCCRSLIPHECTADFGTLADEWTRASQLASRSP
jgi:hypothetical protein